MFAPLIPRTKAKTNRAAVPAKSDLAVGRIHLPKGAATPGLLWDFAVIPVSPPHRPDQSQEQRPHSTSSSLGSVQPKLEIGAIDDPFEHDADRLAEAVVSGRTGVGTDRVADEMRRVAKPTGQNQAVKRWGGRQRASPKGASLYEVPDQQVRHPSGGEPLSDQVRERIENVAQADLSEVRIHRDSAAEKAAASVNARAFTHGDDIWLGKGESPTDTRLIAHEAAHVIQQRTAPRQTPTVQRDIVSMTVRGDGDSGLEKQDSGQWYRSLGDDFGSIQRDSALGFHGGFKSHPSLLTLGFTSWSYALGLWKVETQVIVDSVENKKGQRELVKFKATLSNLIAYIQNKDGSRESESTGPGAINDGPSGQNWQGTNSFYAFDAPRWGGDANQGKTYFVSGDWVLQATHGATTWRGGYHVEFSFTDAAPASGSGKFGLLEEPHLSGASSGP